MLEPVPPAFTSGPGRFRGVPAFFVSVQVMAKGVRASGPHQWDRAFHPVLLRGASLSLPTFILGRFGKQNVYRVGFLGV